MKKILYLTAAIALAATLTACTGNNTRNAKNSREQTSSKSSPSSTSKKSSSDSSSSRASSSAPSISSSEGEKILQERYSIGNDDGSSLQDIPDAAGIPELESLKNFHLSSGISIRVNGEELHANDPKTSYEEAVAALGSPSVSADADDPGNSMHFWETAKGRIMASFSNNELASLSYTFRDSQPAKTSYSSITTEDTPKSAMAKLGQPESFSRSKNSTSYTYKESGDQKFTITVQGNQITGFTSPYEYEQTQKIVDSTLQRQQ